mgnify:CR=1 FL=1
MKKTIIIFIALLATGLTANAQTPARITVKGINADSLSKVILKEGGRELLIKDASETLFNLDCSRQNIWTSLESELESKGFRLLDINNNLVAVSSKELLTKLPD